MRRSLLVLQATVDTETCECEGLSLGGVAVVLTSKWSLSIFSPQWVRGASWRGFARAGFHGAGYETLLKRSLYRGSRKARRAKERLQEWTRAAYDGSYRGPWEKTLVMAGMMSLGALTMMFAFNRTFSKAAAA